MIHNPPKSDLDDIEARARTEWEASEELRQEFSDVESYAAYKKAMARGLVRIAEPKVKSL